MKDLNNIRSRCGLISKGDKKHLQGTVYTELASCGLISKGDKKHFNVCE